MARYENAVAVLTSEPLEEIIRNGSSGKWGNVTRDHVMAFPYLLLVRNGNFPRAPNDVSHKTAFAVGRISSVVETDERTKRGHPRLAIGISHIARVDVANAWTRSSNPVRYVDLRELGISPDELDFEPVGGSIARSEVPGELPGISIEAARAGLAARYNVRPDSIDFIFRG